MSGSPEQMKPDFVIPGQRVNLRTTVESDIGDYERWHTPDWKAWEFDAPYLDGSLDKGIEGRRKWLAGERGPTRLYVSRERGAVSFVTSSIRISVRMYGDECHSYRNAFSWDSPDSVGAQRSQLLDPLVRFPKTRKHAQNGE